MLRRVAAFAAMLTPPRTNDSPIRPDNGANCMTGPFYHPESPEINPNPNEFAKSPGHRHLRHKARTLVSTGRRVTKARVWAGYRS
jgi:glycine/D-amino acid oxidase-like deaminating enzyme